MADKFDKSLRQRFPDLFRDLDAVVFPELNAERPYYAEVSGEGVHTGQELTARFYPARDGRKQGLQFFSEIEGVEYLTPALWTRLSGTARSTALVMRGESRQRFEVRTIEHLMSAAYICGLPPLDVQLLSQQGKRASFEMPILDGAAFDWLKFILLNIHPPLLWPSEGKTIWKCIRSYEVKHQDSSVVVAPGKEAQLSMHASVAFPPVWQQELSFTMNWLDPLPGINDYYHNIAPARTFALREWIDALRAQGMGLGGTLDNALVLDGDQVVNEGGFKVPSELAAHKLLDGLGDFALLGAPLVAEVYLNKASHQLHLKAVAEGVKSGALVQVDL